MVSKDLSLLETSGYRVTFHRHRWTDCWVRNDDESWHAAGEDEDEALRRVLRAMLPSRLAQDLYERVGAAEGRPRVVGSPLPTSQPGHPTLIRPADASPPSRETALDELAILQERVSQSRGDLALCAAEHQRLAIMAWICEARAQAERFPEDQTIREEVTALSRTLTELGKAFWPGSVTALQLHIQPSDLPRHVLGGTARTWHDAALRAEQALWGLEAVAEHRARDRYGYALDPSPAPPDPDGLLDQVERELVAASGIMERGAEPEPDREGPSPVDFERWAGRLRWIRPSVSDPERWARCLGRLRWWASRRHVECGPGERALDPGVMPPSGWASAGGAETLGSASNARAAMTGLQSPAMDPWAGKQVLCVVTRREPLVQEHIESELSSIRWQWRLVDGVGRQPTGPELAAQGVELVLSALGLQSAVADRALARSARDAQLPYVRTVYGQPKSVARCLELIAPSLRTARAS
ncbi:MAG: hypothetical protein ACFB9M_15720 [Myxococcota bacterium]